jgi:catechol 2,3-dioxygenase-like lactoylglutathione lyase family enzyme
VEPHIDVITLAVGDLNRSLTFYRDGLALETTGVVATEIVDEETNPSGAIVIFPLKGGLVLALYPRTELAKDANIPVGPSPLPRDSGVPRDDGRLRQSARRLAHKLGAGCRRDRPGGSTATTGGAGHSVRSGRNCGHVGQAVQAESAESRPRLSFTSVVRRCWRSQPPFLASVAR